MSNPGDTAVESDAAERRNWARGVFEMPDGVEVKVVENDAAVVYLVLPEQEDEDLGLTADELRRVAAGITQEQLNSLLKVAGPRH